MTRPLNPSQGKTVKGQPTTDTKRASNIKGSEQTRKGQQSGLKESGLHSKGQGFNKR